MKPSHFALGASVLFVAACGTPAGSGDGGPGSDVPTASDAPDAGTDAGAANDAPGATDGSLDAGNDTGPDAARDATVDAAPDAPAPDTPAPDAGTCPAPPEALPDGPLTRYAGNPMLRNGPETYDAAKTGPRVVLVMGAGDYRVWYEAVAADGLTTVGYATSADGLSWTKRGTVMSPASSWEGNEVSPNSILVENGLFRLWYHGGGSTQPHRNVGYAESADGMNWTRRPDPVLTVGPAGSFDDDETAEPRVFRVNGGYRMYYTGHNASSARNALGMAESADGVAWTKYAGSPVIDQARWGNFWGGAFFHEGAVWHLWHGVEISGGGSQLEYMWSADGLQWNDGPSNPVLTTNPDANAADALLVGDSVSGYRDGSQYRIMYTGFNWNLFGSQGRFEGVCLAWVMADPRCP